jgi:hypothetical protein
MFVSNFLQFCTGLGSHQQRQKASQHGFGTGIPGCDVSSLTRQAHHPSTLLLPHHLLVHSFLAHASIAAPCLNLLCTAAGHRCSTGGGCGGGCGRGCSGGGCGSGGYGWGGVAADATAEEDMYAPILKPQLLCWMLPPSTRRLVVDAIPIRALPFRL